MRSAHAHPAGVCSASRPVSVTAPFFWQSSGELSVLGTGYALPGAALDTADLLDHIGPALKGRHRAMATAIAKRMAIRTRHVSRGRHAMAAPLVNGRSNPDLAARAVSAALAEAGLRPNDLGYLIAHTATPAQPLPANVALVADRLSYSGPHIELRQACTGFANAVMIAFGLLGRPGSRPVAIVGSETGSAFFDPASAGPNQIVNLVQMGDGAGAVILGSAGTKRDCIHSAWYGATGLGRLPGFQMRRGGSDRPEQADGMLTFDHDFRAIAAHGPALFSAAAAAATAHGISIEAADLIIPHQTSGRIGAQLAMHFGLPEERFFVNADRLGNTGSAAIWLALAELRATRQRPRSATLVLGAEATKYMHGGFVYESE